MPAQTDPQTQMPLVEGLPPLLVRVLSRPSLVDGTSKLPTGVGFEVVWVAPLSPCHGVVQSPTFRDAPIDYGDLVLWDGAPVAEHRIPTSRSMPVFALLEILRRGDERRWPFVALEKEPGALTELEHALPGGTRIFVQQERFEHHCAACEAGEPHEHEAASVSAPVPASVPPRKATPSPRGPLLSPSQRSPVGDAERRLYGAFARGKVIVPAAVDLVSFRDAWQSVIGGGALAASLPCLYEELGETKHAGQEHQAWRGIEGKALRQKANR